jgi:actin-related protein
MKNFENVWVFSFNFFPPFVEITSPMLAPWECGKAYTKRADYHKHRVTKVDFSFIICYSNISIQAEYEEHGSRIWQSKKRGDFFDKSAS